MDLGISPINPNPKKHSQHCSLQAGDVDIMSQPRESRDFDGKGHGIFFSTVHLLFQSYKTAVFVESNGLHYKMLQYHTISLMISSADIHTL